MLAQRFLPRLTYLLLAMAAPSALVAQISIQITIGPPPIPIYEQPMVPEYGYAWTPGYWGWEGEYFEFHRSYWGLHVGFYGGINYGHGYGGGFEGGYGQGQDYYNRSVTKVNTSNVTYVYNKTVVVNNNTYIAYNGGAGGATAAPTERERTWAREPQVQPTVEQTRHHEVASQNRELLASAPAAKPASPAPEPKPRPAEGRPAPERQPAPAPRPAPEPSREPKPKPDQNQDKDRG
ncbi:MAG TPA: hypothetical protein VGJ89_12370 [Geothrix sp.]